MLLRSSSIFLFCVTAIGCASLPWSEASQIESVLEQDLRFSQQMKTQIQTGMSSKDATSIYINNLRKINISHCPPDFQKAFLDHIEAWEYSLRANGASVFIKSFIGTLLTVTAGDSTLLKDAFKEANASSEVNRTWSIVNSIAQSYGASVD